MPGKPVEDFSLPSTGGGNVPSLRAPEASKLVLYFYPKDNTPGCTTEGMQFRDLHKEFRKVGCAGLRHLARLARSRTRTSRRSCSFPFELLSDAEEKVCSQFGVIKMKNMYGKKVRGIERSTFVIDANGMLAREWRGVKVPGHVQEVLDFVKTL